MNKLELVMEEVIKTLTSKTPEEISRDILEAPNMGVADLHVEPKAVFNINNYAPVYMHPESSTMPHWVNCNSRDCADYNVGYVRNACLLAA